MSDHEHARLMLRMAEKDHTALQGMLDTQIFADEIFGFHAQQAAEKALHVVTRRGICICKP